MNGKFIAGSLKFLLLATLLLLAFFREPRHQWMYIAVFGGWCAALLIRFLAGRIAWLGRLLKKAGACITAMRRKAKAIREKKRAAARATDHAETGNAADKLLLSHLSCRVTDKLKAVFPDATWFWLEENPGRVAEGGTARIRVKGADEYTHADVTVDEFFRIGFEMIKIVSLKDIVEPVVPETENAEAHSPAQANVADWYEWVGKEALHEVITELNTRGYSRVFIKETGEVYVVEDGSEAVKAALKGMPGKSGWAELVDVLAAGDLCGEIDNDRLTVAWA